MLCILSQVRDRHRANWPNEKVQTLCWLIKNGSSISRPPSWTIHQTSIVPSFSRSWFPGKRSMFLATSRAWWASVVSLTVSAVQGKFRVETIEQKRNIVTFLTLWRSPIKFLLEEESRACSQPAGQAIKTALCFIPPSPADWMSREKPSRRLEDTTTWEKPFVRSAVMAAFRFCGLEMEIGPWLVRRYRDAMGWNLEPQADWARKGKNRESFYANIQSNNRERGWMQKSWEKNLRF